ncbi:MAG: hypothetical protein SCG74_02235, partial [Nitrospiraceae bacterium]|nr:hypothetical protein [Nitrospiraceae bacterium]
RGISPLPNPISVWFSPKNEHRCTRFAAPAGAVLLTVAPPHPGAQIAVAPAKLAVPARYLKTGTKKETGESRQDALRHSPHV